MSFHDLRQLADNSEFSADICIIGAGPAGLSIALQFQDTSARVCVVESGGLERHENVEALNEFENVGLFRTTPDLARCRGLGGTSNLWTGRCGVFDAIDYQPRPWLPFSGWPIQYDDVSPFFDRAGQLLGLGPALYDHRAREVLRQHTADAPWDPQRLLPVVWQFSRGDGEQVAPPSTPAEVNSADHLRALQHAGAPRAVNLGQAALPILSSSKNIALLLHATATSIETNEEGSKVRAVSIATLDGKKSNVRATCVVLACGGIDNARLLLESRSSNPRGLGNANDLVGRFLTDHPLFEVASYEGNGSTLLRRQLGHRWLDRASNRYVYQKGMRLSPDLQRREELLNCAIHVLEYADRPAPISLAGSALRAFRRGDMGKDFSADLLGALKRPHKVASGAYDRYALRRPSLQKPVRVALNCVVEQQLDPASRIVLSQERDALGMSRAKIDWRASDLEFETVRRMTAVFTSELARLRYKMPTVAAWLEDGPGEYRKHVRDFAHPMCSTRMSTDPSTGVVDKNCEVHGVSGLFVAGSSVFSTAGYMNPTLMIVSLSLKLADHLKAKIGGHSVKSKSIAGGSSATDRRARVGIVGAGDRIKRIYLPIFRALHDEFEIVGFTNRSREKSQLVADDTGYKFFSDAVSMVRETKPDFVLVAISAGAIDATMPSLIDLKVPLLVETPFSWSVRKGRKTLKRIRQLQLTVGVAEQTPHLPLEQLKRQLIDLGLVGRVLAVKNDFAVYDYHGIAALRAYIGSYKTAVRVNAIRADFPMSGIGADGLSDDAARERWIHGSVVYDDGTLLIHDYSNEYFDAPLRAPRSLRVYGTSGSIIDDAVIFQHPKGGVGEEKIRRELFEGRLTSLVVETPLGPVRWKNPFAACEFNDEQIAVATLLRNMRLAVHFEGSPAYSAADALQDMEILEAMRRSSERGGTPVKMPFKPTYHAVRGAVPSLIRKQFRRLIKT